MAILLVLGCGWYIYKTEIEIHPYIKACSDLLKSNMKSLSSYKLDKATMLVPSDGTTPFILIEYEAKSSFGTMIAEKALFNFCYQNPLDNSNKLLNSTKIVYEGKSLFEFECLFWADQ